jgi:multicomponent Na+:H+ antiporter subunit D
MALAPLTVVVPIVIACVLAGLSPFVGRHQGLLAVAGGLAALVLAALVLAGAPAPLVIWFGGWRPHAGVAVGVAFAVDGLGAALAVFVAALGVIALLVSSRVIGTQSAVFDALILVFLAAMLGFCLTGDLFNLFVFFELMSVSAYVLVGYEVRHRAALEGSLTFAITNTVGSILLLFGIALLYGRTDALNLAQMGEALAARPADGLVIASFALVACGLLVKAAVVPFHLWTADAYAVAPTPVCILLAGAFSELGLYGLVRVYWTVFDGPFGAHAPALRAILIGAGVLTALVGAVMCASQHHLKRMLAFATIAQVGLFLVGLGLLSRDGLAGAALWIVADGLVKASLFVCVAILQHRFGSVEIADLHGRGRGSWTLGALFVVGALLIASLPPAGPFLGKAIVEEAALTAGAGWLAPLLALVTGIVGGTLLSAGVRIFLGRGARAPRDPAGEDEPDRESGDDRGGLPVLRVTAGLLLAAAIAWPFVPGLLDSTARAAGFFVDRPAYAAAVLRGARPATAGPELHGATVGAYLYAGLSLAIAVGFAAVRARGTVQPPAGVAALRRLHSGRPGDYVTWTVLGAVVLWGLLAIGVG